MRFSLPTLHGFWPSIPGQWPIDPPPSPPPSPSLPSPIALQASPVQLQSSPVEVQSSPIEVQPSPLYLPSSPIQSQESPVASQQYAAPWTPTRYSAPLSSPSPIETPSSLKRRLVAKKAELLQKRHSIRAAKELYELLCAERLGATAVARILDEIKSPLRSPARKERRGRHSPNPKPCSPGDDEPSKSVLPKNNGFGQPRTPTQNKELFQEEFYTPEEYPSPPPEAYFTPKEHLTPPSQAISPVVIPPEDTVTYDASPSPSESLKRSASPEDIEMDETLYTPRSRAKKMRRVHFNNEGTFERGILPSHVREFARNGLAGSKFPSPYHRQTFRNFRDRAFSASPKSVDSSPAPPHIPSSPIKPPSPMPENPRADPTSPCPAPRAPITPVTPVSTTTSDARVAATKRLIKVPKSRIGKGKTKSPQTLTSINTNSHAPTTNARTKNARTTNATTTNAATTNAATTTAATTTAATTTAATTTAATTTAATTTAPTTNAATANAAPTNAAITNAATTNAATTNAAITTPARPEEVTPEVFSDLADRYSRLLTPSVDRSKTDTTRHEQTSEAKELSNAVALAAAAKARELEEQREREAEEARLRQLKARTVIAKLTSEWETKVENVRNMKNPQAEIPNTHLTRHDFGTLIPKSSEGIGWLNDGIILEFLNKVIAKGLEKTNRTKRAEEVPQYHAFSSYLYSKWASFAAENPGKSPFSAVTRWVSRAKISGARLLDTEEVLIPINDKSHWVLISISGKNRSISYYDSLGGRGDTYTSFALDFVAAILGKHFHSQEWKIIDGGSVRQINGVDCGAFVCMNALALIKGLNPATSFVATNMPAARRQIAAVLLNGGFSGDFDF